MYKPKVISLIITALYAGSAVADNDLFTPKKVSVSLSSGFLSGEAKERVYAPEEDGRKISQLNWKYSNAAIIKGHLDWDFMPWVSFGASGWSTLASRGSHMDDYDWLDADQKEWTEHSKHPNTQLNYANQFDLNLTGWVLNAPEYRLGLMAGYQQSAFSWTSKGGSYSYENGANVGEFTPGMSVIGYSQKFKLPYIGITGLYRYEKWEVNGAFKFSHWVSASDSDNHYLRDIIFNGKVTRQGYYGLMTDVGYYLTDNAKVFIEGTWNRMLNKKGSTFTIDHSTGNSSYIPDSAGIEHTNYSVTAGLKYTF